MKKWLNAVLQILLVLVLAVFLVAPSLAQGVDAPSATVADSVAWMTLIERGLLYVLIFGFMLIAGVLAVEGLRRSAVNVSPEAIQAVGLALQQGMLANLQNARDYSKTTSTPLDDMAVNLATVATDVLLAEARKRGLVPSDEKKDANPPSSL